MWAKQFFLRVRISLKIPNYLHRFFFLPGTAEEKDSIIDDTA